MSAALAIPATQELEALGCRDRWQLEAALAEVQPRLREINDAELRQWVEVDGKTQTEIAEIVGLAQQTISHRCWRLGIKPKADGRGGRPKAVTNVGNSEIDAADEPEVVEGEVVDFSMAVHYSSATDEWSTPQDLFDELDIEFGFELDVCALDSSAKCAVYFTPETDGLAQEWRGTCWMNPPYGDVIGQWMKKASESADAGATVVCLVPARVDTGWWWDYCRRGEIRFLRGRLKFGESNTSAPFPSVLVVLGPDIEPCVKWWER